MHLQIIVLALLAVILVCAVWSRGPTENYYGPNAKYPLNIYGDQVYGAGYGCNMYGIKD